MKNKRNIFKIAKEKSGLSNFIKSNEEVITTNEISEIFIKTLIPENFDNKINENVEIKINNIEKNTNNILKGDNIDSIKLEHDYSEITPVDVDQYFIKDEPYIPVSQETTLKEEILKDVRQLVSTQYNKIMPYIGVPNSGGGTVAKQYANGGFMTGSLLVTKNITAGIDLFVQRDLYVDRNTTISNNLSVNNNTHIENDLFVDNNAYVDDNLFVEGNSYLLNNTYTNTLTSVYIGTDSNPVSSIHIISAHFHPLAVFPPHQLGTVFFDANDHALTYYSDIPDVSQQIGQESWIRVVNKSGVEILNGQVVYISGAQGNRPKVDLANNSNELYSKTIGVATHNIAKNQEGYITTFGIVRQIDTSTPGYANGDELWLSSIDGGITNVKPLPPQRAVKIGYALNSTINGAIFVKVDIGGTIRESHDVYLNTTNNNLSSNSILTWNKTLSAWTNNTIENIVTYPIQTITTDYIISDANTLTYVVSSNDNTYIVLPSVSNSDKRLINIKKKGLGTLTVSAYTDETIDDLNEHYMTNYDSMQIHCNGLEWFIL